MRKTFKHLIGLSATAAAVVPMSVVLSSCNCGGKAEYTDYLNVTNFDDIKLVDPLEGKDAQWKFDVTSGETSAMYDDLCKQTSAKYLEICTNNKKLIKQDLEYYLWKATQHVKSNIDAFQGTFNIDVKDLIFSKVDTDDGHYIKLSFTIDYDVALTYNDYIYAPYEGYQTQVNMSGKYEVFNLYLNIKYNKVNYETKKAYKPTFELTACPNHEADPTYCLSNGKGIISYYDEDGQRVTYDAEINNAKYKADGGTIAKEIYWTDPVFCFVIYWYRSVKGSVGEITSYSLQNVETTINVK